MKTSKITTTFATLNLLLFMSVSSIATPVIIFEGDIIKSGVKKQIESVKSTVSEITSIAGKDFSHLRFDINKFNTETEVAELPLNPINYLRFDVNSFSLTSDLSEMPVNEFDYLRFYVINYSNASEIYEMPVDEFVYLRFDVNKYADKSAFGIDELPVN